MYTLTLVDLERNTTRMTANEFNSDEFYASLNNFDSSFVRFGDNYFNKGFYKSFNVKYFPPVDEDDSDVAV